jgi:hypothetical protein
MHEIKESDWKLFKEVRSEALQRFCQKVLVEVKGIDADQTKSFHQRYLEIYRIVHDRDKELAKVFDYLRRSTALFQIAALRMRGLLSEDEFMRFSEEARNIVNGMLARIRTPAPPN